MILKIKDLVNATTFIFILENKDYIYNSSFFIFYLLDIEETRVSDGNQNAPIQ
jgi:hypothetical protein